MIEHMANPKHFVYLMRSAPYNSHAAQEGLDALLAAAAFAQQVSVLFFDEGVFQLLADQQPQQQKNLAKMLQALAMYDVERCFVHQPSLAARAIEDATLCLNAVALDDRETRMLLAAADQVLTF